MLSRMEDKVGWSRAAFVHMVYRLAVALRKMIPSKTFEQAPGKTLKLLNETR